MMNRWSRVLGGGSSFPEFRLLDHTYSTGDCMITRVSPPKSEPLKGKSCCSLIDHWRCQCLNILDTIIICWERVYCNEHGFTLQGQLFFSEALELSLGRCQGKLRPGRERAGRWGLPSAFQSHRTEDRSPAWPTCSNKGNSFSFCAYLLIYVFMHSYY